MYHVSIQGFDECVINVYVSIHFRFSGGLLPIFELCIYFFKALCGQNACVCGCLCLCVCVCACVCA